MQKLATPESMDWNKKLLDVLKRRDSEGLARLCQQARNERQSTELLSRLSGQSGNSSTKMSAAGDEPIGF